MKIPLLEWARGARVPVSTIFDAASRAVASATRSLEGEASDERTRIQMMRMDIAGLMRALTPLHIAMIAAGGALIQPPTSHALSRAASLGLQDHADVAALVRELDRALAAASGHGGIEAWIEVSGGTTQQRTTVHNRADISPWCWCPGGEASTPAGRAWGGWRGGRVKAVVHNHSAVFITRYGFRLVWPAAGQTDATELGRNSAAGPPGGSQRSRSGDQRPPVLGLARAEVGRRAAGRGDGCERERGRGGAIAAGRHGGLGQRQGTAG
jgi:hypothetical protein